MLFYRFVRETYMLFRTFSFQQLSRTENSMATRLELTWIGKEKPVEAEPRFLLERPDLSCHLAIACRSLDAGSDHIPVKKIPQMLPERCEFGKADYVLNIIHPPVLEDEECSDE